MPTPEEVLRVLQTLRDRADQEAIAAITNIEAGNWRHLESPGLFASCPYDTLDVFGNGLLQLARNRWEVLPILQDGLEADDRFRRNKALEVLESLLDAPSPSLREVILDLLEYDHVEICQKVVHFAAAHNSPSLLVREILARFTDASPAGKRAIESLLTLPHFLSEAFRAAMALKGNAEPELCRLTTTLAGKVAATVSVKSSRDSSKCPDMQDLATENLKETSRFRRVPTANTVTEGLTIQLLDAGITRLVLDRLDHEALIVREAAADSLGRVIEARCGPFRDDDGAPERFQELMRSPHAPVRRVAMRLAPLQVFLDSLLISGLRDPALEVRSQTRTRISHLPLSKILEHWRNTGLGTQLAPALEAHLTRSFPPDDLGRLLIDSVPPEDWQLVSQHFLWHTDPVVQAAALQFLDQWKRLIHWRPLILQAVGVFRMQPESADGSPRVTATRILGMAGRATKSVVHTLVDAFLDRKADVHRPACEALCDLHGVPINDRERTVSLLLEILRSRRPSNRTLNEEEIALIQDITQQHPRIMAVLTTELLRRIATEPEGPIHRQADLLGKLVNADSTNAEIDAINLGKILLAAWGKTRRGRLAATVFKQWGGFILSMPVQGGHWAVHIHHLRKHVRRYLASRDIRYLRQWLQHEKEIMRLAAVDWMGELPPEQNPRKSLQGILRMMADANPFNRYLWHATLKTFARWGRPCREALPQLRQTASRSPHANEIMEKIAVLEELLHHRASNDFNPRLAVQRVFAIDEIRRNRGIRSLHKWIDRANVDTHRPFPFQAVHLLAWESQAKKVLKLLQRSQRRYEQTSHDVESLIERLDEQLLRVEYALFE